MVPETYTTYFAASVGASAALIGLLFVAIAVAPERIFGREGTARGRAIAGSAFLALLDAFFVSLGALLPGANLGYTALVMSISALINTLSMGRHMWEERRDAQGLTLLFGSFVLYALEIRFAVRLLQHAHDTGALDGLAYLLFGAYGLGVARAWELLGGGGEGLLSLFGIVHRKRDAEPGTPSGAGQDAALPKGTAPPASEVS